VDDSSAATRELHAVALPTGRDLFAAVAGALRGDGPALLPIDPALPEAKRDALLAAMRPNVIRTTGGVRRLPDPAPIADDTALVIATSGSTGAPKGVELSRTALTASARATLDRISAAPGDRWLCCLPTSHIAGLQVLTRSVVAGTEPVLHARFTPESALASGAAHVSLVPTQLRRLLDAGADLSVFATIVLGGAAASPGLLAEAAAAGGRVVTTYGMSETCGGCVYDGVPLDGVRVELREEAGGVGRIALSGPALFTGYRLAPELTAEVRDGAWFATSDLGRFDDGRLRVLGRVDDVINTGGEKVVAGEVSRVLSGHPGVADVVVVGRADREWGQRVTAVVVPADPGAPPTLADLRAYARDRLPGAAAPRELDLVPEIPLLPSGKPDRAALIGA
jgi:O-succinylbenzoic acid--CoA ligase